MMQGIRREWANRAGQPNRTAIRLVVNVSGVNCRSTDYNLQGTVDVADHPANDEERELLAEILFHRAEIADKARRAYRLTNWCATSGGTGVRIEHCEPIPVLGPGDISNLRVFEPPGFEDDALVPVGWDKEHEGWWREYQANRYCRFESRKELNQRFQDIHVNTVVLSPSGRIAMTANPKWYRLSQHVIDEMLMRGQPLTEQNLDPRVDVAAPFKDGELCKKAGDVAAARGTNNDVVVKYGSYDHMKQLFEQGRVWINPATTYGQSGNQAIRDDERGFEFKGGYRPWGDASVFFGRDNAPEDIGNLAARGDVEFVQIFDAPHLSQHEYAKVAMRMRNYWTYCVAGVLDPRLFADFDADACLVIRKRPFVERLAWRARLLMGHVATYIGEVAYEDPLGASHKCRSAPVTSIQVHMTKLFRYAYQREFRFAWVPRKPVENLKPMVVEIGSISDIAELLFIG